MNNQALIIVIIIVIFMVLMKNRELFDTSKMPDHDPNCPVGQRVAGSNDQFYVCS